MLSRHYSYGVLCGWCCQHKRPARQQVRCVFITQTIHVRAEVPLPVPITQHTPGSAFIQCLVIHTGAVGERERSTAALDAALNAELLLDILDAVKRVMKFLPVYHLIAQGMHVCLDSPHARVKMV
jgi:hypothetical protein